MIIRVLDWPNHRTTLENKSPNGDLSQIDLSGNLE